MILKKICLLGDFAVGKTSLVRRYVDRQFSDVYLSTVGVKISRKLLDYSTADNPDLQIQIVMWDIEGSTELKTIPSSYINGAHGAVVVGDFTRGNTLQRVEAHIAHFFDANPAACVVAAFNKADLVEDQALPESLAGTDKRIIGALKTSAKTGDGVDHLFDMLGRHFIDA